MTDATPEAPAVPGLMPFVRNLDTARAYWWLDIFLVVLADGADTGGRYPLMHETLPRGAGAPPRKHTWSDEHFYMQEGECSFLIGEGISTARAGEFVHVPRNTRDAFRVDSKTAAFLNGYTPSGSEFAVIENLMPAPERDLLPPGATPMPRLTSEQYRRYGMDDAPGPNPFAKAEA